MRASAIISACAVLAFLTQASLRTATSDEAVIAALLNVQSEPAASVQPVAIIEPAAPVAVPKREALIRYVQPASPLPEPLEKPAEQAPPADSAPLPTLTIAPLCHPPCPCQPLCPCDPPEFSDAVMKEFGLKPITAVITDIHLSGQRLPTDTAAEAFQTVMPEFHSWGSSRPWYTRQFAWSAPALCHRPLYFEDENLERYGYHFGIFQPALSAAHFFGRVPVIPYMRGARSPRECVYTLGYYRPGNHVPFFVSRPPVSIKGAVLQGAATTGAIYVIP